MFTFKLHLFTKFNFKKYSTCIFKFLELIVFKGTSSVSSSKSWITDFCKHEPILSRKINKIRPSFQYFEYLLGILASTFFFDKNIKRFVQNQSLLFSKVLRFIQKCQDLLLNKFVFLKVFLLGTEVFFTSVFFHLL